MRGTTFLCFAVLSGSGITTHPRYARDNFLVFPLRLRIFITTHPRYARDNSISKRHNCNNGFKHVNREPIENYSESLSIHLPKSIQACINIGFANHSCLTVYRITYVTTLVNKLFKNM